MFGYWIWTLGLVALVLLSQNMDWLAGSLIAKPLASFGFLAAAYKSGAMKSRFGVWVFVALVFSWFGDVFLISKEQFFLPGLVSFLLAHLSFCLAFLVRQVSWRAVLAAFLVMLPLATGIGFWLMPFIQEKAPMLLMPVVAYVSVIVCMVCLAAGSAVLHRDRWVLLAALAFFFSDISVARDSFVESHIVNRLWGLPLYYIAQLMFAMSVSRSFRSLNG